MGLFEVHFHDSEFRPSMHVGPKGAEDETDEFGFETEESGGEEAGGRSKVLPLVVVSVVLALVATLAAKKLKGDESEA